ncbi:MAG: cryptochrome/photolyase family protein [Gammaproteobacteria bacterium]|nr:cryptochrome/photolyase family protein [Gammaproteobacteria bacterium]
MTHSRESKTRRLVLVLGDQLNVGSAVFDDLDPKVDAVLMTEVRHEDEYVPQHKVRLALFFSAMRHFRDELQERRIRVHYAELDDRNNRRNFGDELGRWIHKTRPESVVVARPGDYRVLDTLKHHARSAGCRLEVREDRHFFCSDDEFEFFVGDRKSLLMEHFYRHMRKRTGTLMKNGKPEGGKWNFDADNRRSFGKSGLPKMKAPRSFQPDKLTDNVLAMVDRQFPDAPGRTDAFDYPVTGAQAKDALRDFITYRLEGFGAYQDAMARGEPYLYHSRLSSSLNLHLLDPREAIDAAVRAYEDGKAPLNAVEGFVRQILGWREYVRGVYWRYMPDYETMNALSADRPAPAFLWTGETEMNCVRECVSQLRDHAYAHHIQRLMVLGLLCLLLGVRPYDVHRWHMSMYADAVDWVSLPNVLGMSQFADGGIVGTKPYCATGAYIDRMSDYCAGCRYDPKKSIGDVACPFTTLYWDFLSRNRNRLKGNRRMTIQFKNLDRKSPGERRSIKTHADGLADELTRDEYL